MLRGRLAPLIRTVNLRWIEYPKRRCRHRLPRWPRNLANHDPAAAATDAGVVIELEPFRETSHVLLMQAHAAAGNTAQALAAYERLRAKLADELGASRHPRPNQRSSRSSA